MPALVAAVLALPLLLPPQIAPTSAQELVRRMNDIDRALLERPDDDTLLRAKVDNFRQAGLVSLALNVCQMPRQAGKPSVCEPALIAALESDANAQRSGEQAAQKDARLFAVIVGISDYQKGRMPRLAYADSDARSFASYLQTARMAPARPENVFLLVNETATAKRIREALETVLAKAGPRDTVFIFISAHGVTEAATGQEAFLMAYDSDPQELQVTAFRLSELSALIRRRSSDIGETIVYADVCRVGPFHNAPNMIQAAAQQQLELPGARLAAVLAGSSTHPTEATTLGGGRGVFSYFLLKGLGGAADRNGDGVISMDELFPYVRGNVMDATRRRQQPKRFGQMAPRVASLRPWLYRLRRTAPAVLAFGFAQTPGRPGDENQDLFVQPGLPFDVVSGPEDEGQQVILNYLQGSEVPQTKQDFENGAEWYRLAGQLKSSDRVTARESFCRGRALTFDARSDNTKYDQAIALLGDAIRLEPEAAYAHNALGIAQLERAQYREAIDSFGKAIERAPYWIYPRHNLALARAEAGDYQLAEREFREAIRIDPTRAHLHYSLGLLYQRRGRARDARKEYEAALALKDQAEPHIGLGSLLSAAGKTGAAALEYEKARQLNPDLLAARHDLAVVTSKRDPAAAIALWEENIRRDPNFTPSRLSLARALRDSPGRLADSAAQYRELLRLSPKLVGARVELAEVLETLGNAAESRAELETAANAEPRNFSIREKLSDLLARQGDKPGAEAAYRAALGLAPDRSSRRRIAAKLRELERSGSGR
jgi:tetratricopeptide (TPR) repeat protein